MPAYCYEYLSLEPAKEQTKPTLNNPKNPTKSRNRTHHHPNPIVPQQAVKTHSHHSPKQNTRLQTYMRIQEDQPLKKMHHGLDTPLLHPIPHAAPNTLRRQDDNDTHTPSLYGRIPPPPLPLPLPYRPTSLHNPFPSMNPITLYPPPPFPKSILRNSTQYNPPTNNHRTLPKLRDSNSYSL